MQHRQRTGTRGGHWLLVLAASIAAWSAFGAQDAPPAIPRLDFEHMLTHPVLCVTDDCHVRVQFNEQQRDLTLVGVSVPGTETDRARLRQFLDDLLKAEAVAVQYEPAAADQPPNTTRAFLFRAPDGLFVNLEVVRQGRAEVKSELAYKHLELLRHYERRAREAEKGIWAPRPERPREPRAAASQPARESDALIVYVTKSGTKYHREGCQYLRKSGRPLPLDEAVKRYEPCSRCKPPTLDNP